VSRCSGSKPDSSPCERIVGASQTYCYSHDPSRSKQRKRAASRAGASKSAGGEVGDIKRTLRQLADDVLSGKRDRGDASVVSQLLGVLLRAVEVERKVRETDELAARLERLEARLEPPGPTGGGRRWGA
jgi:hypothetical protein